VAAGYSKAFFFQAAEASTITALIEMVADGRAWYHVQNEVIGHVLD
jgi:hypothetical protein